MPAPSNALFGIVTACASQEASYNLDQQDEGGTLVVPNTFPVGLEEYLRKSKHERSVSNELKEHRWKHKGDFRRLKFWIT